MPESAIQKQSSFWKRSHTWESWKWAWENPSCESLKYIMNQVAKVDDVEIRFDLTLVRGQGYYTSTVLKLKVKIIHVRSVVAEGMTVWSGNLLECLFQRLDFQLDLKEFSHSFKTLQTSIQNQCLHWLLMKIVCQKVLTLQKICAKTTLFQFWKHQTRSANISTNSKKRDFRFCQPLSRWWNQTIKLGEDMIKLFLMTLVTSQKKKLKNMILILFISRFQTKTATILKTLKNSMKWNWTTQKWDFFRLSFCWWILPTIQNLCWKGLRHYQCCNQCKV